MTLIRESSVMGVHEAGIFVVEGEIILSYLSLREILFLYFSRPMNCDSLYMYNAIHLSFPVVKKNKTKTNYIQSFLAKMNVDGAFLYYLKRIKLIMHS